MEAVSFGRPDLPPNGSLILSALKELAEFCSLPEVHLDDDESRSDDFIDEPSFLRKALGIIRKQISG